MNTPNRCAEWLSQLVQIPSVNPTQAGPHSGPPGEGSLATRLIEWFAQFGAEIHTEEVHPGRSNVYGLWRGQTDRWIAVDVHIDTVGVEQMNDDRFSGRIADGRVYGRGAVDTKASLGVILALLESMHQQGVTPQSNLLIAATVDEENGAQSAPIFARWIHRQQIPLHQLIIAEPTLCCPVYGHKGGIRFEFTVTGRASHSSTPQLGQNAVTAAAHLVLALEAEDQRIQALPPHPELGTSTMTVTIIQGGTGSNVVPDSCKIYAGWRSVPGDDVAEITARIQALAERSCPLPVSMTIPGSIEPFYQSPDTVWLRQLAEWSGFEPTIAPYATNAWAHSGRPYECVVLGPGSIDQAHGAEEWVEISELEKLADIYRHWWELAP
ncbi:MAG: M20/M25/M40 family metallo-hydrolase, partial [Anaerolineae bacterium]|nr:M20/M25/M40 family metallo-hydrolase [Anaerolineae bacterium]